MAIGWFPGRGINGNLRVNAIQIVNREGVGRCWPFRPAWHARTVYRTSTRPVATKTLHAARRRKPSSNKWALRFILARLYTQSPGIVLRNSEALVHCCTAATSRGCRCRLSFRNIWSLVSRLPLRSLRHRVSHRRFNRVTRVSIGISSPFENQFQRFVSRWFFGLPECFIWARNFYSQKIFTLFLSEASVMLFGG